MVTTKSHWTQRRWNSWTLKIVVACCIVFIFLSPTFSRKLPADSEAYLGRRVLVERRVEMKSEVHGQILDQMEGDSWDLTDDYPTVTHNHNNEEETLSLPVSKATVRGTMRYSEDRLPRQFARYTSQKFVKSKGFMRSCGGVETTHCTYMKDCFRLLAWRVSPLGLLLLWPGGAFVTPNLYPVSSNQPLARSWRVVWSSRSDKSLLTMSAAGNMALVLGYEVLWLQD